MALATVRTAATAMITAAATSNDAVNDARTAFPPTYHGQLTSGLRLPLLLVLRRREVQSGSALLGSKQSIVTKDHSNKKELNLPHSTEKGQPVGVGCFGGGGRPAGGDPIQRLGAQPEEFASEEKLR